MRLARQKDNNFIEGNYKFFPEHNILSGIENLTDEELNSYGYYKIEDVAYNPVLERLGGWILGEDNIVRKEIIAINHGTLEQVKNKKIEDLKKYYRKLLCETDWYFVRRDETEEEIPSTVLDGRLDLRIECSDKEIVILAFNSIEEVLNYDYE